MKVTLNERIDEARSLIEGADHIIIGAGAGLSTAAGLDYGGERFLKHFGDFKKKYGITDMYSASFYPFQTKEEFWAQWARHIWVNRYDMPATKLYKSLFELVKNKSYFVITTNVESQFEKAGFAKEKIFEVQGNYAYLQCEKACHNRLYRNEELIGQMKDKIRDCKVPSDLIPNCPICGGHMDVHLRHNEFFVQDAAWYEAQKNYEDFLTNAANEKVLFMEFGVGYNTPGIIRYPFEQMVYRFPSVNLLRFNKNHPKGPIENEDKTLAFTEDIGQILGALVFNAVSYHAC